MIDLDSLLSSLWPIAQARVPDTEVIRIEDAFDRVLAKPVISGLDVPGHDNTSMDGYAVRCADFLSCSQFAVSQRVPAGSSPQPLEQGTVARVFTGAPIPEGADAVIMQEEATVGEDGLVAFANLPKSGQWIRRRGEDIVAGQVLVPSGTRLNAFKVSLIASVGVHEVEVYKRLKVGVFVTGSELQRPGQPLNPGQIFNSNEYVWRGLLRAMHVEIESLGIVPDTLSATCDALRKLHGCDVVISSGGVSVGEEDHVKPAVESMGTLSSWKVASKPGKPLAVGELNRDDGSTCRFFGLPGNPVSSSVAFLLLVKPFIALMQGHALEAVDWRLRLREKTADFDWLRPDTRREEFLRVRDTPQGLTLFPNQSSGVLTSMDQSTGLVRLPVGKVVRRGDSLSYVDFQDLMQ
ncbi:molybdopterin molybdotransferase MoeA [Limnobacter litoralis]|uniref:Molybdopterin molybdenumtransferase n=1 Tax=Limnobacter litoralis TaxID=481366 RepID=A0ABQ5YS51_9BURK|nr:molybdopterin molybdotransferase MoeA [Limnobacter litoralis]GLR25753.1 molybdopterin molybdenumtransferase MoeA [Limnobacter litoralis]